MLSLTLVMVYRLFEWKKICAGVWSLVYIWIAIEDPVIKMTRGNGCDPINWINHHYIFVSVVAIFLFESRRYLAFNSSLGTWQVCNWLWQRNTNTERYRNPQILSKKIIREAAFMHMVGRELTSKLKQLIFYFKLYLMIKKWKNVFLGHDSPMANVKTRQKQYFCCRTNCSRLP